MKEKEFTEEERKEFVEETAKITDCINHLFSLNKFKEIHCFSAMTSLIIMKCFDVGISKEDFLKDLNNCWDGIKDFKIIQKKRNKS